MKILVTGSAGFIGYHFTKSLLVNGNEVLGIDNLNDYYDPTLKQSRLNNLIPYSNFSFEKIDIANNKSLKRSFELFHPRMVVHLAAQAGVRHSIENPYAYLDSNLTGFLNILELCRHNKVEGLIYASSSSVYGANTKMPCSTLDRTDKPIALYGATKKANELMAHAYSYLYGLHTTGLRFFTVYGPWGRPDMALFLFTKAILEGEPIEVYNNGEMKRDFTYIDDIINGLLSLLDSPPNAIDHWNGQVTNPSSSKAPFKLYNIGNNSPVNLMDFISEIENQLGKKAKINYKPLQPGDVVASHADVEDLVEDFGYRPSTLVAEGIREFVNWYKEFYKI